MRIRALSRLSLELAFLGVVIVVFTALVVVPRVGTIEVTAATPYAVELRGRPTFYVSRPYSLVMTFGPYISITPCAAGFVLDLIAKRADRRVR